MKTIWIALAVVAWIFAASQMFGTIPTSSLGCITDTECEALHGRDREVREL